MWELVAAGLEAKAAATAGEVLLMRADILLDIIAGRMRLLDRAAANGPSRAQGGGGGGDGERRRNPDGTETIAIKSMASLAAFMSGRLA